MSDTDDAKQALKTLLREMGEALGLGNLTRFEQQGPAVMLIHSQDGKEFHTVYGRTVNDKTGEVINPEVVIINEGLSPGHENPESTYDPEVDTPENANPQPYTGKSVAVLSRKTVEEMLKGWDQNAEIGFENDGSYYASTPEDMREKVESEQSEAKLAELTEDDIDSDAIRLPGPKTVQ